ncbi:MAG: LytTR family DNA-binding domain-containing protein [Bacteroidota bacterium]
MFATPSRNQLNLHIFDYKFQTGLVRYSVILVISLVLAHLSRQQTPFTPSYSFPLSSLVNFLLFGLVVCTSSWVITNTFKRRIFSTPEMRAASIIRFLAYNLAGTVMVYTLLYTLLFHTSFNLINFLTFLLVSLGVVVVENLIYLLYTVLQHKAEGQTKDVPSSLMIPTGIKSLRVELENILYAKINKGLVTLYAKDRKAITTQFSTLDELEKILPRDRFYRANRQYLIHKNSVKQLVKGTNRKLVIQINEGDLAESISVSRYKSKEVTEWLNQ